MGKQIISIFLILQILIFPFSQTVYGIDSSNEKKIVSYSRGEKPYHDHILDSIDRPDTGYIQGVTFRGLGDEDKDLFYKLVINDKDIGTLKGEEISADKKRYVNFKKFNNQKPLYIGDKIELYIGNYTNDTFEQKVFEFGNVNSIALDVLTPERINYSKDGESDPLRVNIVLNTNVPKKGAIYSFINLSKNQKYPMSKGYQPENGIEGAHLKTDGITIQSQDDYVILAEFEDVEYYMPRMSGQEIMGVENDFYTIQKSNNYSKVIGGKSNLYLETTDKYSKEQQYYFEYDDIKGAYKIIQKFSGNRLVYKYKENKITVEKIDTDHDDQFWILEKTKSGKYKISSYYNKKIFLTIDNNQIDIVPKGFQDGENQEFELNNIKLDIMESKYAMISASNKNKLISINQNNSNVELSDIKSYYDIFQQFDFKYVASKGAYKLINTYDNNNVVTWTSSKNNNVSMYADNEYDDQLWIFEEVDKDIYIIANLKNPNRVLNVDANGVNISVAERYNTTKQQFILKDIDFNIDSGKHLIKSSSDPLKVISNDDNNILLKDREELSIFQEFTFKYIENKNAYQIIHINSGLAVSWASNSGGYNVMLYRPNVDYDDQLWNFEKLEDGVFTIYNLHDKTYVLNIDQDGKNISVAKRNNSTNQKFILERISAKVANGNYVIKSNKDKSKVVSNRCESFSDIRLVDEVAGDKTQEFIIKYVEEHDAYKIIQVSSNFILTYYNNISKRLFLDNDKVMDNHYQQLWSFEKLNNGSYIIYDKYNPDHVLNIHKYVYSGYTDLEISKRDGSENQEFVLSNKTTKIPDGDYTVESNYNELKVLSGNSQTSKLLKLEDKIEGLSTQIFSVKYIDSKEAYQIIHKQSGLAVSWDSQNGDNIILYQANLDYDDQLWAFEKDDETDHYTISNIYNPRYVLTTNNDANMVHMGLRKTDIKQKFKLK